MVKQATNVQLVEVNLCDGFVAEKGWPLIPPGTYTACMTHHETQILFNTPKVFLHFKIVEPGKYFDIALFRAFRVKGLVGKPGKNGRFKLSHRSELLLTLLKIAPDCVPRFDRISLKTLRDSLLKVRVETVVKDYLQRPLHELLQYSVVRDIDIEIRS